MLASSQTFALDDLRRVITKHWGFATLRPLQEQAMRAVLEGRDSLVVLPTGGGKSLCYQAPAVLRGDTTIVISPLISLMKDQVDGLQACGIPAIQIDSSQTASERTAYEMDIAQGAMRLVFVSPERLVATDFYRRLQQIRVRTFAIDEAHCISHWGHDFRPEYRQLRRLIEMFPQASVHAYTATATEQVRRDIIQQLGLRQPEVLVGNFDRPNLTYRILPRQEPVKSAPVEQVRQVVDRHRGEAGIIYCIRRADVEDLTGILKHQGYGAMPYHAGMTAEARKATQDAFAAEECDLVVATVAFGMGIDRSNIRFVLHTGMPKSIEHYQQETGRAGRDGLEAECVLLHAPADFMSWKYLIEKSAGETGADPSFVAGALKHLNDMDHYCRGAVCRHRALVEYFGQSYPAETCAACDLCLGDTEEVPDAVIVAQKILSCVARVQERFGVGHVISVLRGENTAGVRRWNHEQLSTYGLLKEHSKNDVRAWIHQLLGQQLLVQEELAIAGGEVVPILRLNPASWDVMKGNRKVRLVQPVRRRKEEPVTKSKADTTSWEGVDRDLFEAMRDLRRELADQRQVPPYIIFNDATLRELARVRPSSAERMRLVHGVGDTKLKEYGSRFVDLIRRQCAARGLSQDQPSSTPKRPEPAAPSSRPNPMRELAFDHFRRGASIEQVMELTRRARSTVAEYLATFIREERPASITTWVSDETLARIRAAVREVGGGWLKPIYLALGERVSYDEIRLTLAYLEVQAAAS